MDREQNELHTFFTNDWLAIQRKYWEAWLHLVPAGLKVPTHTTGEEHAPADVHISNPYMSYDTAYPTMLPAMEAYFSNVMKLSRISTQIMEQLMRTGQDAARSAEHRLHDADKTLAAAGVGTAMSAGDSRQGGLAFWSLPLDTWRRTMSSMLPLPGDFLDATKDEGVARITAEFRERLDRFLGIPAVGYSRESVDQYQRFASLYLEYIEALEEYNAAFVYIGVRSMENYFKKLTEWPATQRINSLRKLYDLWVDAYEEVYADYTMSDEYSAVHGRMINALVAVKHEGSLIVDEFLDGLNMPTRREINSMHHHINELQRQNHVLRAELQRVSERLGTDIAQPDTASMPPGQPH